MADDGNRQVALTLEQVAVSVGLNAEQFDTLDMKLNGINGAINKLAENVSEPNTSVAAEIAVLNDRVAELGAQAAGLKEAVTTGATDLRDSLATLTTTISNMDQNLGKWLAAIALAAVAFRFVDAACFERTPALPGTPASLDRGFA